MSTDNHGGIVYENDEGGKDDAVMGVIEHGNGVAST